MNLDKTKTKKLNQLQQTKTDLHSKRHMLTLKNAELLPEYERLKKKNGGSFSDIFTNKSKLQKVEERIEEVASKLVEIDNQLDKLEPQIEAAALAVYQDYFEACEKADKEFQDVLKLLQDKNRELREIFEQAADLLDLNRLATEAPYYTRIDALANEVQDKKIFWNRMKQAVINKLSTQNQNGTVQVFYETKPPRRAIFAGKVHRVRKEQAEKDIAEGFAIPMDEYEKQ